MHVAKYHVRLGGRIPQDVVEMASRSCEEVCFFPAGGGLHYQMPAVTFDESYRAVSESEFRTPVPHEAKFDIEDLYGGLPGYSFGYHWNGWARPLFPKESCERIIAEIPGSRFDPDRDAFIIPQEAPESDEDEFEIYLPSAIQIGDKFETVWAIGNGSWTWDETN